MQDREFRGVESGVKEGSWESGWGDMEGGRHELGVKKKKNRSKIERARKPGVNPEKTVRRLPHVHPSNLYQALDTEYELRNISTHSKQSILNMKFEIPK